MGLCFGVLARRLGDYYGHIFARNIEHLLKLLLSDTILLHPMSAFCVNPLTLLVSISAVRAPSRTSSSTGLATHWMFSEQCECSVNYFAAVIGIAWFEKSVDLIGYVGN